MVSIIRFRTLTLALGLALLPVSAWAFGGNGGSSGGGGGTITPDASLNTAGGFTGLNTTPEQHGALANGKTFYAGAMDNNSTANLTDTTNHPFVSGDVGKLICVDQVGTGTVTDSVSTRHVETCGTISSFTSSSVVVLSFNNTSGASVTGKTYSYATNDTTAIQAAETAACNAGGGAVWFPALAYGLNGSITKCQTANVNWYGFGSSQKDLFLANLTNNSGGAYPSFLTWGTNLQWLTKSMASSSPGVLFSGIQANDTVWWNQTTIQNLSLTAGVGTSYDGAGGDGVDFLDWWDASLVNVEINGFKGSGVYLDTLGTSGNDYTGNILFAMDNIQENGTGMTFGGTHNGFLQNFQLINTVVQNNNDNGVLVAGTVHDLDALDSNFQRNDEINSTSFADVFFSTAGCLGCTWTGDYFEADFSNEKTLVGFSTSGDQVFPNVIGSFFIGSNGNTVGIYLGNGSTTNEINAKIDGNYFSGFSSGKNIEIVAIKEMTFEQNFTADVDALDVYTATSNVLGFGVTTAGGIKVGSSTGLTCSGTPTSSFATVNGIVTHC